MFYVNNIINNCYNNGYIKFLIFLIKVSIRKRIGRSSIYESIVIIIIIDINEFVATVCILINRNVEREKKQTFAFIFFQTNRGFTKKVNTQRVLATTLTLVSFPLQFTSFSGRHYFH